MFSRFVACLLFFLFFPLSHAATTYIELIPDLTQTDIDGEGTGDGQQYCAPVSVSNSLAFWLEYDYEQQKELVETLASEDYMNTDLNIGTGTHGVMNGVSDYAMHHLGGYKTLDYEGWRSHPERFQSTTNIPDIKRVLSAVSYRSTAWLNIGWYKSVDGTDDFDRVGGHWVTLVGSTQNELVIHDPAPRAGQEFSNQFVSFIKISSGNLTGGTNGLPVSAAGYFALGGGLIKKSTADHAILDGVVYFVR